MGHIDIVADPQMLYLDPTRTSLTRTIPKSLLRLAHQRDKARPLAPDKPQARSRAITIS
jgi:hypothetical protein